MRKLILVALGLCLAKLFSASPADAAIKPALTVTKVQGEICAAPCAVYVDTLGTTADGVSNPYADLTYKVYCDGNEGWGAPRSFCLFDTPGRHAVMVRYYTGTESTLLYKLVTVNAQTSVRRILLSPGVRYPTVALPPGPGILTTDSPGSPRAIIGNLTVPSGWTVTNVNLEGPITLTPETSNVTVHDISSRSSSGNIVVYTGGTKHPDLLFFGSSTFVSTATNTTIPVFLRSERTIFAENTISGGNEYAFRTVHFPGLWLFGNRIVGAPGHNALQLRAWGGSGPPNVPSEYFGAKGNVFETTSPSVAMVRTCQTNTCDNTHSSLITASDVQHGIFEDNTMIIPGNSAPPPSFGFWVAGGDLTIRRNTVECLTCNMNTSGFARFVQQLGNSTRKAGLNNNTVQVYNNHIKIPRGVRNVTVCDVPTGTGHLCVPNSVDRF